MLGSNQFHARKCEILRRIFFARADFTKISQNIISNKNVSVLNIHSLFATTLFIHIVKNMSNSDYSDNWQH